MEFMMILAGAVLTLMTVAEAAAPLWFWYLPLGGSPIAQMGIVLGLALASTVIAGLVK